MNFTEKGVVIWHDNADPIKNPAIHPGCTYESAQDIESKGGLEALINSYEQSGITIYEIDRV